MMRALPRRRGVVDAAPVNLVAPKGFEEQYLVACDAAAMEAAPRAARTSPSELLVRLSAASAKSARMDVR